MTSYSFDPSGAPALRIRPGAKATFETRDARNGALDMYPAGVLIDLPLPPGEGNPVSGPVAVDGAEPGDALVVEVEAIQCGAKGWIGAHVHMNTASEGRIPRARARICAIDDGQIVFSPKLIFPIRPMIGCIGTAPCESISTSLPGRHGGNLDHPIVAVGSRVWLPVNVEDALLYIGDVHAAQGDGELSSSGIEVDAEVTVRVHLKQGMAPDWPWVETDTCIAVLTCGRSFEEARAAAVDAILSALERDLGLEPAEGLALVSAVGHLRIGQACGVEMLTLRLELPRIAGLRSLCPCGTPQEK